MADARADLERVVPRLRRDFETSRRLVARAIDRANRVAEEALAIRRVLQSRMRQTSLVGSHDADIWEAAADEVLRVTRERDRELCIVAHEMRQPLAAAVAAQRLLDVTKQDVRNHARSVLARQLHHLSELIDGLLDYSRLTAEAPVLPRLHVDMIETVQRAIESVESSAGERRQEVCWHCSTARATVIGDPARLRQAVVNLLQNSVRYTPEEGRIDVSLATTDGNVRLDVRDTGEGLAPDRLERVFDPFVRISLAGPGLGIGLTLVRRIAGLHGGSITAASDGPGCGSTFTLMLPLAPESHADA